MSFNASCNIAMKIVESKRILDSLKPSTTDDEMSLPHILWVMREESYLAGLCNAMVNAADDAQKDLRKINQRLEDLVLNKIRIGTNDVNKI